MIIFMINLTGNEFRLGIVFTDSHPEGAVLKKYLNAELRISMN